MRHQFLLLDLPCSRIGSNTSELLLSLGLGCSVCKVRQWTPDRYHYQKGFSYRYILGLPFKSKIKVLAPLGIELFQLYSSFKLDHPI